MGIEPTVDELIWLHETGKAVETAVGSDNALILDLPVRLGAHWLHRPTIGFMVWWDSVGKALIQTADPLYAHKIAWLLTIARSPEVLKHLVTAADIEERVRGWMTTLGCTFGELTEAVSLCLRLDGREPVDTEKADQDVDWCALVAECGAVFGGSFSEWLWAHSADRCVLMLRKAARRAAGNGQPMSPHDPMVRAVHEQQQAFKAIVDAHQVGTT